MNDTLTRAIVDVLGLGSASAAEVAAELEMPAEKVRRRLRELHQLGMVVRGDKTERRGISEILYSFDSHRGVIWGEELSSVPSEVLEEGVARTLRLVFRESLAAIDSGSFTAADEHIAVRCLVPLDERGVLQGEKLHDGLLAEVIEAAERGKERILSSGEPAIRAMACILFFEAPAPWPAPFATGDPSARATRRSSNRNPINVMATLIDPLRMKLIDALTLGPASAEELARRLRAPLEKVRYELGRLQASGFLSVHSREQRRGLQTQTYICDSRRLLFDAGQIAGLDRQGLDDLTREIVFSVSREVLAGIRTGSFGGRKDSLMARMPMGVDRRAFREISELMTEATRSLLELREACLERSNDSEQASRVYFSDLLLFEQAPS